VYKCM